VETTGISDVGDVTRGLEKRVRPPLIALPAAITIRFVL
jgi:hypothetical protein